MTFGQCFFFFFFLNPILAKEHNYLIDFKVISTYIHYHGCQGSQLLCDGSNHFSTTFSKLFQLFVTLLMTFNPLSSNCSNHSPVTFNYYYFSSLIFVQSPWQRVTLMCYSWLAAVLCLVQLAGYCDRTFTEDRHHSKSDQTPFWRIYLKVATWQCEDTSKCHLRELSAKNTQSIRSKGTCYEGRMVPVNIFFQGHSTRKKITTMLIYNIISYFAYRISIYKVTSIHSFKKKWSAVLVCKAWAQLRWHFQITTNSMHHRSRITSENVSLRCQCERQLNIHRVFFRSAGVQVLRVSSFTSDCCRGQAGSQKEFYIEVHEWTHLTAGMCFCAAQGEERGTDSNYPF